MQPGLVPSFVSSFPVTCVLMVLILAVSLSAFIKKRIFPELVLHPYSIYHQKQYYRLFTSDLVHVDLLHLALNEFMLYIFCSDLEETLRRASGNGSLKFLLIYLCSMLAGSVIATLRHKNDFSYSSAGASGSIMGCMFGFILLKPNYIAFYVPVFGGIKNIYGGLVYILVLIVYQRRSKNGMIDHELHFFGAAGGLAAAFALFPHGL